MALTAQSLRTVERRPKPYKLFDSDGLYLQVPAESEPKARPRWRFRWKANGREKLLSLGVFPTVPLALARKKRDEMRAKILEGIDPAAERRKRREREAITAAGNTFEEVAREWVGQQAHWKANTRAQVERRLERELLPWLGSVPCDQIEAPELLQVLRRTESRGAIETAHRVHQLAQQVFAYAIATGRARRNPAADIRGALKTKRAKHHASVTDPRKVGELLRAIHAFEGTLVVSCALRLAPLVFVRPGELRQADWSEMDLDAAEWRIPAERMKMNAPHIVPLSTQAVAILRELQPLTGPTGYVFPSQRSKTRPMSENTVNAALRRLGYSKDEATGHGFRSMASTLLNEQQWHRDAIERQLAHAERDKVRAAYNYADHLPERRKMMQAWADYLDGLRSGAKVTNIRGAG